MACAVPHCARHAHGAAPRPTLCLYHNAVPQWTGMVPCLAVERLHGISRGVAPAGVRSGRSHSVPVVIQGGGGRNALHNFLNQWRVVVFAARSYCVLSPDACLAHSAGVKWAVGRSVPAGRSDHNSEHGARAESLRGKGGDLGYVVVDPRERVLYMLS